jgi:hypothetical protein
LKSSSWFDVDRKGLAQLIGDRGKEFIIYELLQNAWDESSTKVEVDFQYTGDSGLYELVVVDDNPEGFKDLSHAFTLFASSQKKDDPTKRGRFNLGEKLVLALCLEAEIKSTKGMVIFDKDGRRAGRAKRESGTEFRALIRMNREEYDTALKQVNRIIPPQGVVTTLNQEEFPHRSPLHTFEAILTTVRADADGVLRPTKRKTSIEVYDPAAGEEASIYEMGIPVVATGDRWHYNVMQKVPLNSERTDVTPSYKQDLRTLVTNEMAEKLTTEDANRPWVRDAMADESVSKEAFDKVMDLRYGEKRVIFDSSDPEANQRAVVEGYTLIHAKQLNRDEWTNLKRFESALPAGKVTPSPKPFSPDGKPLKTIPQAQWTKAMWRFRSFAAMTAAEVLGKNLAAFVYADDPGWGYNAAFGQSRELVVNFHSMGRTIADAFERNLTSLSARKLAPLVDLLIHEYAHYYESNHLSENYYRTLTKIGSQFTTLALENPDWFLKFTDVADDFNEQIASHATAAEDLTPRLF